MGIYYGSPWKEAVGLKEAIEKSDPDGTILITPTDKDSSVLGFLAPAEMWKIRMKKAQKISEEGISE